MKNVLIVVVVVLELAHQKSLPVVTTPTQRGVCVCFCLKMNLRSFYIDPCLEGDETDSRVLLRKIKNNL